MDHPKNHSLFGLGLPGSNKQPRLETTIETTHKTWKSIKPSPDPNEFFAKNERGWKNGRFSGAEGVY